jgi:hypothetical protein
MKQEDIDKKIGMPDVDAEWAKFEREVINPKTASQKPLYWGIGIAASIALVASIFLIGHDTEAPQQTIAQKTTPTMQIPSTEDKALEEPVESIASPKNKVSTIVDTKQHPELLAEVQEQAANDEQQTRIAGLTIVPTSADLGSNSMRLAGTSAEERDTIIIGRKPDYDFLSVVNGQPLSEADQKRMLSSDMCVYFFKRQQLLNSISVYKDEDNKRPYIEKYGERAKNGVVVISTVPDTICDAYIQQHPELMQKRHRVEGNVIDEVTKEPLSDVWVQCWEDDGNDNIGGATDYTGHFVLWLPRKDVKLQASRVGYIKVRITKPADTTLTIRMTPANILKDVKIVPKASQNN